jgi:hypothetical protein
MQQGRSTGFVIADDDGVLKVRVTTGPFTGKKLRVVTTHEHCQLAVRLEIDFFVGQQQGQRELFPVAVDARPVPAIPKCDCQRCGATAEIYIEVCGSDSESAHYIRTCLPHVLQQIKFAETLLVSGHRIIRVANAIGENQSWRTLQGC